jgi:hypothetical protein
LANRHGLALQAGRAGYPVAFGQHAHHLAVRVLADLPDQVLAVGGRHPVLRLDLLLGVDLAWNNASSSLSAMVLGANSTGR